MKIDIKKIWSCEDGREIIFWEGWPLVHYILFVASLIRLYNSRKLNQNKWLKDEKQHTTWRRQKQLPIVPPFNGFDIIIMKYTNCEAIQHSEGNRYFCIDVSTKFRITLAIFLRFAWIMKWGSILQLSFIYWYDELSSLKRYARNK